jgi:hypothetical protein
MADIAIERTNLEDLRRRASELASAVDSITILFDEEAIRLRRRDQVARLNALRFAVLERVEGAKIEERAASSGHSQATLVVSLFRLGAGVITMASENRTMRAISRQLLAGSGGREPPFGTVLIRVGSGGIPGDVDVVNISSLARESNRGEREVMDRLMGGGNLLFGDEAFSLLVDRLAAEILRGALGLPVSTEKLSQLQEWRVLRLTPENKE